MKCACEIAMEVIANETMKKQTAYENAMSEFNENLENIDGYVEQQLLKNKGKVELLIEKCYVYGTEDFYCFAEKHYPYSPSRPYWYNKGISAKFPLEFYIAYLRSHCYEVDVVARPFIGYSSSGKSSREMEGLTLKISI